MPYLFLVSGSRTSMVFPSFVGQYDLGLCSAASTLFPPFVGVPTISASAALISILVLGKEDDATSRKIKTCDISSGVKSFSSSPIGRTESSTQETLWKPGLSCRCFLLQSRCRWPRREANGHSWRPPPHKKPSNLT